METYISEAEAITIIADPSFDPYGSKRIYAIDGEGRIAAIKSLYHVSQNRNSQFYIKSNTGIAGTIRKA